MADDPTERGPQDRSRINLSEDYEVRYWTEKLKVSVHECIARQQAASARQGGGR
jgi:hypothetical protein